MKSDCVCCNSWLAGEIYRLRFGACSFGTPSTNERPSSRCLNEALGIGKAGVYIYKSDPTILFVDLYGEVRPKILSLTPRRQFAS